MLAAAIALGARTDDMDDAVWLSSPRMELAGASVALGRQYPHVILVNAHGRRFVNESDSYLEVGKAMYTNDAVPAWLIFDDAFQRPLPLGSRPSVAARVPHGPAGVACPST